MLLRFRSRECDTSGGLASAPSAIVLTSLAAPESRRSAAGTRIFEPLDPLAFDFAFQGDVHRCEALLCLVECSAEEAHEDAAEAL